MTEQMTGAQSIVRSLEAAGVDTVFGIPGGAILPLYDPLMDSTRVRHVLVRHEQGGGHAAAGYAAATGRVGVCIAGRGVAGALLVPHEDVPEALGVHERVVGRQDRATRDAEDDLDAGLLERPDDRLGAVDLLRADGGGAAGRSVGGALLGGGTLPRGPHGRRRGVRGSRRSRVGALDHRCLPGVRFVRVEPACGGAGMKKPLGPVGLDEG